MIVFEHTKDGRRCSGERQKVTVDLVHLLPVCLPTTNNSGAARLSSLISLNPVFLAVPLPRLLNIYFPCAA